MMRRPAVAVATLLTIAGAQFGTAADDVAHPPAARPAAAVAPPQAKIAPKVLHAFGDHRRDDYFWLSNRHDPAVRAYLESENAYAERRLEPLQPLIAEIERELYERAAVADTSPEFSDNRFIYRRRIAKDAAHPVIVRRHATRGAPEQVVLDVQALAAGHEHYDIADYLVSPDGHRVAFTVDLSGGRAHRIFVRDIASGEVTDTGIMNAGSDLAFSADSQWLFYVRVDAKSLRSRAVWRHRLGTAPVQDHLVYEEPDPTFDVHVAPSRSGRFIMIRSEQAQSTETRYVPADQPLGDFRILEPRRPGVVYVADHIGNHFYIRTNWQAPDYRLMQAPEAAPDAGNWTEFIAETPGRLIAEFELFDQFIALIEEHDAVQAVRVVRLRDGRVINVPVPEGVRVADISFAYGTANRDTAATQLQLRLSGPRHPPTIYSFDIATGDMVMRKRSERWFEPQHYEVRQLNALAPDGESVPITLTYRKDRYRPGTNPVVITGYGAYGVSTFDGFPGDWVSLIDRGFVFVQAHVRGGQEKGVRWYDGGRLLNKRNSFNDFIAATEAVIAQGYADPKRVFAHGGSAGGLLVGAVVNMRPELFAGVVAEVPFVDVITTMSDPDIPLTTLEYQEWGDPALKAYYDVMRSYSPYDNVAAQAYPAMLVTAAWHDSQVGYHEPAKWVARLRATKTDSNELLLMTRMNSGHGGNSGRFGTLKESARIMAWLLAQAERQR